MHRIGSGDETLGFPAGCPLQGHWPPAPLPAALALRAVPKGLCPRHTALRPRRRTGPNDTLVAYRGPGNFQLLLFRCYHCPPRSQPAETLGIPRTPERCWAHSGRLWSPLGTGCSPLQTVTMQYNPLPCRPSLPAFVFRLPLRPSCNNTAQGVSSG